MAASKTTWPEGSGIHDNNGGHIFSTSSKSATSRDPHTACCRIFRAKFGYIVVFTDYHGNDATAVATSLSAVTEMLNAQMEGPI